MGRGRWWLTHARDRGEGDGRHGARPGHAGARCPRCVSGFAGRRPGRRPHPRRWLQEHAPQPGTTRGPTQGPACGTPRPRCDRAPAHRDATPTTRAPVGARAGQRTPPGPLLLGSRATRTAPHLCRGPSRTPSAPGTDHRAARVSAHPPSGAAPDAGPGTGGRGSAAQGVTRGRRRSDMVFFSLGHARQQGCGQKPNAGGEPRPMAAATQERRLLGVGSSALFGTVCQLSCDAGHQLRCCDDGNTLIRLQGEEITVP